MTSVDDDLPTPDSLGARLRVLRTSTGLSGKDFAARIGWAASKVSRIERSQQFPSAADIDAWAAVCGVNPADWQHERDAARPVFTTWQRQMREGQAAVQRAHNEQVEASRRIAEFQTSTIPGLLQTADLATALMQSAVNLGLTSIDDMAEAVRARLARQRFLYSKREFTFLLTEDALRWLRTPVPVMRAQLDRLQTVIGLPNVRLGILPFSARLDISPQHSFLIADDVVYVEMFVGESVHTGEEARHYQGIFERLWVHAAVGDDARRLIIAAADALPRE